LFLIPAPYSPEGLLSRAGEGWAWRGLAGLAGLERAGRGEGERKGRGRGEGGKKHCFFSRTILDLSENPVRRTLPKPGVARGGGPALVTH